MLARFYFFILLNSIVYSQLFYSPVELATVGAAMGGRLGTHSIQSNPALLGLKPGETFVTDVIDTFNISYRIEIAYLNSKENATALQKLLKNTGPEHNYIIEEKDSIFILYSQNFKDILSASMFVGALPDQYANSKIIPDTTDIVIKVPKKHYLVQLIATPEKDTLRAFKKRNKKLLLEYKGDVSFIDSLYKYRIGGFSSKLDARTLKDSVIDSGISSDAFIIEEELRGQKNKIPRFTMNLPIGFNFNFGNNVIDADWINNYTSADMVINPDIKDNLLASIPSDGLTGFSGFNASVFRLSYGSYGLSLLDLDIYQKSVLPKPLFQVIFKGVFFNQNMNISDFDTRFLITNASVFSYGKQLRKIKVPFKTYIGFGLRFLTGGFGEVQSFSGNLSTKTDSITIKSNLKFAYGLPAAGIGIDFGLFSELNERLTTQISFMGIGSSIRSSEVEVVHNIQRIELSNLDIEKLQKYNQVQRDSLIKTFNLLDTTYIEKGKRVSVPCRINLGLSYQLNELVLFHTALQKMVQTEFIGKVDPRISIGAEFFSNGFSPVRMGIAAGGMAGFYAGAGFGVKMKMFHLNFGFGQSGGLGNSSSGVNMAAEIRLFL